MDRPYLITMTITRVTTYETVVHAADADAAEDRARSLVPDDMDEVDQQTTGWSTEVEPITEPITG